MKTMRWESFASLAVGAWLVTSSWALNAVHPPSTTAVIAMVGGAALIVLVVLVEVLRLRWTHWHALLLSVWACTALAALEFTSSVVTLLLVGFVALAIAAWAIATDQETRQRKGVRRG